VTSGIFNGTPVNQFEGDLDIGDFVSATATCPAATPVLLGGGYRLTRGAGVPANSLRELTPTASYPSATGTWTAEYLVGGNLGNDSGPTDVVTLTAYAVCSA